MTRLFNLESYPKCCQDAQLFEKSIEHLSPEENSLPLNYKRFLANHQHYPYLPQPLFVDELPDFLTFNSHPPSPQHLGEEVEDGEDKQLFIIPDTIDLMTLSSRGIFGFNESYLYRSAYLYWNYVSQLPQLGENQRLVLIDLDSFHPQKLLPLRLESHSNSSYPIPILDQQSDVSFVSSEISEEVKSSYDRIIESLSRYFLETHFPQLVGNPSAIAHLPHYLKKQAFLQQLSCFNSSPRQILLEINTGENLIYKTITVSPDEIRRIVTETVNLSALERLSNHHRDYIFVIVSHWNNFLSQENSNLVYINPDESQFGEILAEKATNEFPLFGIALDKIECAIALQNQKKWIQITDSNNNISYEGKKTEITGVIPENNQRFFTISTNQPSRLPLRVNGEDYTINNSPQDYVIEVINSQNHQQIEISFQFEITPGKTPRLKVIPRNEEYKVNTYLQEKLVYHYIPSANIISQRQINTLNQDQQLQILISALELIKNLSLNSNQISDLNQQLTQLSQNILNLINIDPDQETEANYQLQLAISENITPLVNILSKEIERIKNPRCLLTRNQKQRLKRGIIFLGKLYKFTQELNLDSFFNGTSIQQSQSLNIPDYQNEYLQFLARIAIKPNFQQAYFSLFNQYIEQNNSKYLWGYGRILLWYYDFQQPDLNIISYRDHFISISNFIINRNHQLTQQYLQDAFLSLIYLLTFSEHDSNFFQEQSEEKEIAEQVVHHYRNQRIILNQISRERSLNQIFTDLVEGQATDDDVENLLQAA